MDLLSRIKKNGLLFDGAMGTMLIREGLEGGKASDFWNLDQPEVIEKIHKEYLNAGADIITTNTFGSTPLKLKKAGLDDHAEEINKNAVRIAKSAAASKKYVAGDIGPTGEMLYPMGTTTTDEVYDTFLEQATYLKDAGVDAFIIETMFDLNESKAAIKAVRSISDLPVFATLTFNYAGGNFATMMGNQAIVSLKEIQDEGADIVGANCSVGSDTMVLLSKLLANNIQGLKIIQPNAGIPETKGTTLIYPESFAEYASNMIKIKNNGISVIGGCCGTTPEYIAEIKKLLSQ